MSVQPLPRPRLPGNDRGLVGAGPARRRKVPSTRVIARRRLVVISTKWLLPILAVALLSLIALWPELARIADQGRASLRQAFGAVASGTVVAPHYRGLDARGRPYMLTADTATQVGPERINLVAPQGDATLEGGRWMMVQSREGVFLQHRDQLDLSGDVQLYRDDGVTMRTQSAAVDLKEGAAASSERTHAEGPFGQLDAQGFTMLDKGGAIQFQGPARLILNQAHP